MCQSKTGNDLAPNLYFPQLPSDQQDHTANTGKSVFIQLCGGCLEVLRCCCVGYLSIEQFPRAFPRVMTFRMLPKYYILSTQIVSLLSSNL